MPNTHKHTLTFEGEVPGSEMDRSGIYGPAVKDAINALQAALEDAGHPHTVESKIIKPKTPSDKPRKPRAVRAAAE